LTSVTIAGYGHLARISPENSHFSDVNLLGGDFCSVHKLALTYGDEGKFLWPSITERAGSLSTKYEVVCGAFLNILIILIE
jgi:hypothetical protein